MSSNELLKKCTTFENIEIKKLSTAQLITVENTAYRKFKEAEKERWRRENASTN